ncbi:hypothetical protein DFH08DRAFT_1087974 [Mycena albidolilacea]|uniref:Uncharacterized protein n=1 Tax=Mycena albidolilacea TaxID=1033008 RepID=A0AAD6Z8E6_9AGAR|nr:hypothetical protein DFH08DRAFT_1087974 [Mycena albidolilacea]
MSSSSSILASSTSLLQPLLHLQAASKSAPQFGPGATMHATPNEGAPQLLWMGTINPATPPISKARPPAVGEHQTQLHIAEIKPQPSIDVSGGMAGYPWGASQLRQRPCSDAVFVEFHPALPPQSLHITHLDIFFRMDLLPATPLFPALTHLGVAIDDPREIAEPARTGLMRIRGLRPLTLTTCDSSSDGAMTTGQIGKLVQREALIYGPKEMNLLPLNELARLKPHATGYSSPERR